MEAVEFSLPTKAWEGLVTKFPADTKLVGADQFTNGSFNFLTDAKGVVTKRSGGVYYNATPFPLPPKDEYEAVFSSGVRHKLIMEGGNLRFSSGGGTFTLVTSGYTASANMEFSMYKNRVYFGNGINTPQVYDIVNSYGGVGYSVPKTKDMGAQPPSSAVTFAADTAGGSVPAGAHTYKVTFLYYDAQESNGGPATGVHTVVNPNNTVNITGLPIGGYGVTARKIYRDNNDGNWLLVGTVSNNTATIFTDTFALGTTPIPTDNGLPPLFSLIVTQRDRLWVAGVTADPSTLYWSEAGLPDIFFVNNRILCNPRDPITALAVYNDKVIVFNRNSVGQILGTTASDFRYSEISPSVGCVDNRSIQTRTIRGVPTLLWLSNIGFYQYNGSSITQVSEEIEDQLQFNIQQALQVKGRNTQSTQADFLAGTSSPGIELSLVPGTITTKGYTGTTNPTKTWDTEAEWENGVQLDNLATNGGHNTLKPVLRHAPTLAQGTLNNVLINGSNLNTPTSSDYTGESRGSAGDTANAIYEQGTNTTTLSVRQIAIPFIPSRSGTLTNFSFRAAINSSYAAIPAEPPRQFRIRVWSDSGGSPGGVIFENTVTFPSAGFQNVSQSCSIGVTGGQRYWFGMGRDEGLSTNPITAVQEGSSGWSGGTVLANNNNTGWGNLAKGSVFSPTRITSLQGSVSVTSSPLSGSGIWTGPTYDSLSDNAIAAFLDQSGSYPSGTSSTTTVEASNDPSFGSGIISQSFNNMNGTVAVSLSGKRYWRIKSQLVAPDTRFTASVGTPVLRFTNVSTWVSEVIDHTADIVSLDALTSVSSIPGGSSVAITIATSADNITYDPYVAIGSATPRRYSKIKIVFTTDAANTLQPIVSSLTLNWTITANLISQVIDTGSTPAGWDLFQADSTLNGGTIVFEVRTASTIPGLTGASWFTAMNGTFITAPVNQYLQFRTTLTSHANQVPFVDSVTINWLIQDVSSIRVASLFYNKQYYLAAAEFGNTVNNVVFVFDENDRWTVYRGLGINTMGTFFNDAYYGSSTTGQLVKWLDTSILTDQGTPVEFDIRTKAFSSEIGDETKTKFLRQLVCRFYGTGARFTPYYSVDEGNTFLPLQDVETGLTYFDTVNNSKLTTVRFTPEGASIASGRTIMLRLYSNDANAVQVHSMRAKCWISPREVLNG